MLYEQGIIMKATSLQILTFMTSTSDCVYFVNMSGEAVLRSTVKSCCSEIQKWYYQFLFSHHWC